ncbi:hypothetical protein HK100_012175 [Physocladia obscura]|uniref:Uncharacterized protein n=1 Tax=Physocladia obscura TaxID=109957 RepID=A0AAD5T081_9FUNG|nr:hypothetical protein HK100_012175 [Physocladia obscura]
MTTHSSRRHSAVEGSHPMQSISPLTPRPNASHPHGIKSAFKELFSKQKKKEKADVPAAVVVVGYSKKKAPVLPVPIATVTDSVASPDVPVSRLPKDYKPVAEGGKKFYFDEAELEGGGPTEALPPSVLAAAPLSKSYQRKLHLKYTHSSLFTTGTGTIRKYTEPDLDRFSFTEPSLQRKFSSTTGVTDSTDDVTDPTDEVTAVSTDTTSEKASKSQEKYPDTVTEDEVELIEQFEAVHGPDSADTDSYYTIHRLSMLPVVEPNSQQVAVLKTTVGVEMTHQLSLGSGHVNLLGTYSDIIEEISDLVPEQDLVPVPQLRPLKAITNSGVGKGLRQSINNLQDLLNQMASETRPTDSTISPENILADSRPEQVVVEEYFVEHWVPADDVSPESSGNGRTSTPTTSKNYETFEVSTPLSSISSLIVEGDVSNSVEVASHKIETESLSADIICGHDSDSSDEDEDYGEKRGKFVVSKVTRVLTLSGDNMVTNVGLKVEPMGKLDQPSAATLQLTLKREQEILDLKRVDAEKREAEISEIKSSQALLKPEDGGGKKAIKRRSGLTHFLNFLIHN